jgi:hypothetical protein
VNRNSYGQEELWRFEVLLYIMDSMRSKRLDHLSVNGCLQIILTVFTTQAALWPCGAKRRENLLKSLMV